MARDEYVTLRNVAVGIDSKSGLAYNCEIEEVNYWVPYSQTRARHVNKQVHGADSIEVTRWWCNQNGIDA